MSTPMLSPETAPRDFESLRALQRGTRYRLAYQLKLLKDAEEEKAFLGGTEDEQTQALVSALAQMDANPQAQNQPQPPQYQMQQPQQPNGQPAGPPQAPQMQMPSTPTMQGQPPANNWGQQPQQPAASMQMPGGPQMGAPQGPPPGNAPMQMPAGQPQMQAPTMQQPQYQQPAPSPQQVPSGMPPMHTQQAPQPPMQMPPQAAPVQSQQPSMAAQPPHQPVSMAVQPPRQPTTHVDPNNQGQAVASGLLSVLEAVGEVSRANSETLKHLVGQTQANTELIYTLTSLFLGFAEMNNVNLGSLLNYVATSVNTGSVLKQLEHAQNQAQAAAQGAGGKAG